MLELLDNFIVRAILAGLGLALAAAPLGCFVIWRRMAYFGDATAHAALLGVALALLFEVSIFAGVLAIALLMSTLVTLLASRAQALDTILGVLAHGALAAGLVAVSFVSGRRVDLMAYLFGDILAVGHFDLALIWSGALITLGLMWWRWSALLTVTLNSELARAAGIWPTRERLILTLALALVVALSIKIVGALLISAMLIIPAAAARPFATTPERMAVIAGCFGGLSVLSGLQASFQADTPTGPTIVCIAAAIFTLSRLVRPVMERVRQG